MKYVCSYIIPRSGKQWWNQERRCERPVVFGTGRCRIHQTERVELGRRKKIDKLIERIEQLGGEVIDFRYEKKKKNEK